MAKTRSAAVSLLQSWVGKRESDGTHKFIIDLYNSQKKLPRSYKVKYTDAWCATTMSAIAIKLGFTSIMPVECSCYYLIEEAKKMGIWQEKDSYVPKPGDEVLYDWQDNGIGDNKGTPDHVGMVETVSGNTFVVIEGNYSDAVKRRTMKVNGRYIRGFICPKYDSEVSKPSTPATATNTGKKSIQQIATEVIDGKWGSGDERKSKLKSAGYDYAEVQKKVNEILNGGSSPAKPSANASSNNVKAVEVADKKDSSLAGTYTTTTDLYCRDGAGKNRTALVKIPKGTKVSNYGYYSVSGGVKWLYIQFTINKVTYTGFSSSAYLKR